MRQWSSAAVREWPREAQTAKIAELRGARRDGAALLRYAGDRPKLKADFKVTTGRITLGMEMDRTVPLAAADPRGPRRAAPQVRRGRAAGAVRKRDADRRRVERLALAAHAAIPDDGAAPAADGARASRALSAATTIALDDDEQADFHRDLGYAPARSSRGTAAALFAGADALRSENVPLGTTIRASTTPRQGCTAAQRGDETTKSRTSRTSSRRSTSAGRSSVRARQREAAAAARRGTARTTPRSRPGATTSRRCS